MKKYMWTSTIAASALIFINIAGCGTSGTQQNSNTSTSNSTQNTSEPTLVLATSADYKPYEYHDLSSGQDKIVGFDLDVANAIAKQLHFQVKVQDVDFNGLIGSLQAGRADFVIAGMTPTAERKKSVDFSDIYYQATNVVLTKKGHTIHSLNDLKGQKVAAQLGSIQESAAKTIPNVQLDSLTTIPNVVQEVVTNRATAAIIEDTVATNYVKNNPDLEMDKISGIESNGSAIALPKGSKWTSQFNSAIAKLKSDGEMQQLANKWFGANSK